MKAIFVGGLSLTRRGSASKWVWIQRVDIDFPVAEKLKHPIIASVLER